MTQPEKVFKMGAVRASVFKNMSAHGGRNIALYKVVIEVRYRDKASGQWKGTNSLSINDLPKAISALQQAYNYLLSGEASEAGQADDPPVPAYPVRSSTPAAKWAPRR